MYQGFAVLIFAPWLYAGFKIIFRKMLKFAGFLACGLLFWQATFNGQRFAFVSEVRWTCTLNTNVLSF
jgi:hypothetical protein